MTQFAHPEYELFDDEDAARADEAHARGERLGVLHGLPIAHKDLAAAEAVVTEAGLTPFNHADYAPGRRFYFFDWDGIEFEMVSYA